MLTKAKVQSALQLVQRSIAGSPRAPWCPCSLPAVLDTLREVAAEGYVLIDEISAPPTYEKDGETRTGAGWVCITQKGRDALALLALA